MEPNSGQIGDLLVQLLHDGRVQEAADRARDALQKNPDDPKITMLAGLALEQLGRIDEATVLLRRAAILDPASPEAFHNLAVCLYNQGDFKEAEANARVALTLDPAHEGAMKTLANCEASKGAIPFESEGVNIAAGARSIRTGPDDPKNYVWNLGEPWTRIGFGLAAYCVVTLFFQLFHPFLALQSLKADPLSIVSFLLYVTSGLGCLFWMLIDIIDRRARFAWLILTVPCGFSALPLLPLALYMAMGRRVAPTQ